MLFWEWASEVYHFTTHDEVDVEPSSSSEKTEKRDHFSSVCVCVCLFGYVSPLLMYPHSSFFVWFDWMSLKSEALNFYAFFQLDLNWLLTLCCMFEYIACVMLIMIMMLLLLMMMTTCIIEKSTFKIKKNLVGFFERRQNKSKKKK